MTLPARCVSPRAHATKAVMGSGSQASRSKPLITVRPVRTEQQLADFRMITKGYLEWLGEDLGFQGIERELASLPGSYATDAGGAMLLAYERTPSTASGSSSGGEGEGSSGSEANGAGSEPESSGGSEVCVGAVALRRLAGHTNTVAPGELVAGVPLERVCEMKRLFVLPGHHGLGVGAALVRVLLAEGASLGYQVMVLDTLERLEGANRLYAALGFRQSERYNDCPLPGVLYFARQLGSSTD